MLESYRQKYHKELVDSVIPFWLKHSLDAEHGGYFTCLDRDGAGSVGRRSVWIRDPYGRRSKPACARRSTAANYAAVAPTG
jgi:N-acylglucosamine 2-epimerase